MERHELDEKLVDYLYKDLSTSEEAEFCAMLEADESLRAEVKSLQSLMQLYRERLPDLEAPRDLVLRVLDRVETPKRSWFSFINFEALWRPALTAAFALTLTLGLVYQYHQRHDRGAQLAQNAPVISEPVVAAPEEIRLSTARPSTAGSWRAPSRFGNGLVSLASFGNNEATYDPAEDIGRLEQEAQYSVAQFAHQQAMRMHLLGDHEGAAEAIADLAKKYPSYPRIFEALALRIGCLFQIGQIEKANQELGLLRRHSPELATLVERRWKR